jgi:hypothetical protein
MFDGLFALVDQSTELSIDLSAKDGLGMTIALVAKPSTQFEKLAASQVPSDFSMVGKLSDGPSAFVAAGRINLAAADAFNDMIFGPAATPAVAEQRATWIKLASNEFGMSGVAATGDKSSSSFMLRVANGDKVAAQLRAMFDAMYSSAMLGGLATIKRVDKPAATVDGLTVSQSEMHYDMSKLTTLKENEKKFTLGSAWTGWDDVVAMTTGKRALDDMKRLIDSARSGKGVFKPTAAVVASIARAKAAKESLWMRIDMGEFAKNLPTQPAALPLGLMPALAMGASAHSMWFRVEVPPMAPTATKP